MITFDNGGRIVESVEELPTFENVHTLYADFETTSGSPQLTSTDPFHHCDVAGIALTGDKIPGSWYVPVGHHTGNNLPRESVEAWWLEVLNGAGMWCNHNTKYDAHVSTNCMGVRPDMPMRCTMTRAKIIDSDRMRYGLSDLSLDWLAENISVFEEQLKPYLNRNKDYGAIPIDVCGEYACQDVLTVRRLDWYITAQMPEQCQTVADVEDKLTRIMFDVEQTGMLVDPQQLKVVEYQLLSRMNDIDAELTKIVGRSFRPHVATDCFDVLCNQYGLPVMAWTEEDEDYEGNQVPAGNPSFDKHALMQYAVHPYSPPGVVPLIQEYRVLNTLNGMFVTKYQELEVNGRLHPSYNQCVRTGRMSCKRPNAMQLSTAAKKLIIPGEGYSFMSCDFSQIEFRFIVHYINDEDAVQAYNENPDTDFHAWVASVCGISRKPAKTVNFLIAFGGGRKTTEKALALNMELVGHLKAKVDQLVADEKIKEEESLEVFNMLCAERASKVYDIYHDTLPSLKRTARRAESAAKMKGYVFNAYGRRRKLPEHRTHIAFNTLCQSSAADLMKERMVAVADMIEDTPVSMIAQVHDSLLFRMPTEVADDPRTGRDIIGMMEHPPLQLRVPIRCSIGTSNVNWAEASRNEGSLQYDQYSTLDHLRC